MAVPLPPPSSSGAAAALLSSGSGCARLPVPGPAPAPLLSLVPGTRRLDAHPLLRRFGTALHGVYAAAVDSADLPSGAFLA